MKAEQVTDPLFHKFRAPDADDGVVRSYAHTWCQAAAIATVVDELGSDPAPASITLVCAQHHNDGNATAQRFMLYREGDDIRAISAEGDRMLAGFQRGPAHAAAELAFALLARKPEGYILFRQP